MSPEQARGEGHCVDSRADIFSLGVVFYEMLTGVLPFAEKNRELLRAQIGDVRQKPQRPRELDSRIPQELDRICMKAIAKLRDDRYASAAEFADDLRVWLESSAARGKAAVAEGPGRAAADQAETPAVSLHSTPPTAVAVAAAVESDRLTRIIPRGLRSFTMEDANFFLELVPGDRTREGLPEGVRWWKNLLESRRLNLSVRVCVMYGPSGCGKSSLIRAGILPLLDGNVWAVCVNATTDRTERDVRVELVELFGERLGVALPEQSLTATLQQIRQGELLPPGSKLLVVLDQFEQWLLAHGGESGSELETALRQCDGGRVQALVMVRDDFWMAVGRFMNLLDLKLLEQQNFAAVALFDRAHARRVLATFGAAYGRLPESAGALSAEQREFVELAVEGLKDRDADRWICVRLAVFADMFRGRDWTPEALRQVGGITGVGTTFLDESFSSGLADVRYRRHQQAALYVLGELLPSSRLDVKVQRSEADLRTVSGYQQRPEDFADLMQVLDRELRLITPVEPGDGGTGWQLTHDYLVPSVRDWREKRLPETRTGRARLVLSKRSAAWSERQEAKQLPTLMEWLQISCLTPRGLWTATQRSMMGAAGRWHALRSGMLLCVLLAVTFGVQWVIEQQRAMEFEKGLRVVKPDQLSEQLGQADTFGGRLEPLLRPLVEKADAQDATAQERTAALPARLVLVRNDKTQVPVLSEALLSGELPSVAPIRERLRLYAEELRPQWLEVLRDEQQPSARRFRAALGLAGLEGSAGGVEWTAADTKFIAEELSKSFAEYQPQLRELLRPMDKQLIPELDTLFDAEGSTAEQQEKVALALADYAGADGERLARLLTRANQKQTEILFPKVSEFKSGPVREGLLALTREQPDENLGQLDRVRLGRRRANAAITLLRQGERELYFDALRITDDPESLSQFVSRCKNWGVTAEELVESLARSRVLRASATGEDRRVEARVMYGLLVALGSYSLEQIAEADREPLIADLKQLYVEDPSAAVHSASGWLLRTWGREAEVLKLDEVEVPYDASGVREWFRLRVGVAAKSSGGLDGLGLPGPLQHHSLTFVVFPAGEYRLGSPDFEGGELDRQNDETPRTVKLSRPFALCDREVTWALYDAFAGGSWRKQVSGQFTWELGPDDVVFGEDWYGWMGFCRWLTSEYRGEDERWQCYRDPELLEKDGDNPRVGRLLVERGGFRLPTEAEWEVAARAGQRTAWTFGSDVSLLGDYGWFVENSGKRPRSAAAKPPGLGGLHDVQGNLFEWVHDWYGDIEGNSVVVDPQGAASGRSRVLRGGGWNRDAANCRLARRSTYDPANRRSDTGFRLALSPSVTSPEAKGAEEKPQANN